MSYRPSRVKARRLEKRTENRSQTAAAENALELVRQNQIATPDQEEILDGEIIDADAHRPKKKIHPWVAAMAASRRAEPTADNFFASGIGADLLEAARGEKKMALVLKQAYRYAAAQLAKYEPGEKPQQPLLEPVNFFSAETAQYPYYEKYREFKDLAFYQVGHNSSHAFFLAYDPGKDVYCKLSENQTYPYDDPGPDYDIKMQENYLLISTEKNLEDFPYLGHF